MNASDKHWSNIYTNTPMNRLGWYEESPKVILEQIGKLDLKDGANIFIPGVGLSSIAKTLTDNGFTVETTDISSSAVDEFRRMYPELANNIYQHNITEPLNKVDYFDLWIDRAVLHFLLSDQAIQSYLENMNRALKIGGYIVLAQFAISGAEKCAGLPVKRYSPESLSDLLSAKYLSAKYLPVHTSEFTFFNPAGEAKPYTLGIFQRVS
ncbi:MAG: methyltransferase domain-containing protein [Gammaproteobacteria bacterium]|nr:methyltransferase domain-containing protein [Gammaproteobacteria bacterium]